MTCLYIPGVQTHNFFIWYIYQFSLPLYWHYEGIWNVRKLKQFSPLKVVTRNVSDFILQGLCCRYSGRVNTQRSVFPIKMMTGHQVFLVKLILVHCWLFSYCLGSYFWGFFLSIGKVLWKITFICAETFKQKSSFLICLPMKNHLFSPIPALLSRLHSSSKFPVTLPPDAGMTFKFSSPHSSPSLQVILDSSSRVSHIKIQTQDFSWKLHLPSNFSGMISIGNGMQRGDKKVLQDLWLGYSLIFLQQRISGFLSWQ